MAWQRGEEYLASEFKRNFPTCPICGSNLGYDGTPLSLLSVPQEDSSIVYYIKCRSCEAVWGLYWVIRWWKGPWNSELRYTLRKPDKDNRAVSLVGKGGKLNLGDVWKISLKTKILILVAAVVGAITITYIVSYIVWYIFGREAFPSFSEIFYFRSFSELIFVAVLTIVILIAIVIYQKKKFKKLKNDFEVLVSQVK